MNILQGKKTYLAASVLVIHQILKMAGYDLPQEQFSSAIDVVVGAAAFFFRMIAKPK